ncbi:histidinol-phosphate transaminase [Prochlorococcus sp. MIT 1223]|uniref:pyridoxal phosphate-dependent aminotransferase n=1 Tax=Prochlorococcus sp. MIT 1223 TaxID=3096217 RepID=UPI002A751476|nr:histidinol-phosphate transaminase [Prochlorococcus sp. MIT 1223]
MKSIQDPSKLPLPRNEVEVMNSYSAPLEGRRDLLRLDFNENTLGPSPLVIEALKKIPSNHIAIYPEYNGLKAAIADNLNLHNRTSIKSQQVGIFNGVDAAIHAIFHAYGDVGEQLLTTIPTFGYYTPCANMQGMEINAVPYQGENFLFPFEEVSKILETQQPKLCVICNPNNPTGTRLSPEKILKLATISQKTLVVIDELYEAFTGDSILPFTDFNKTPNLIVLRSLSKTAGLAGLRIGFAIGNPEVLNLINRVTGPYDINSFAVTAAFAALKDQSYVDNYIKEVLNAKLWIKKQLSMNKIDHHIDGGNYLLIWPNISPNKITASLKLKGILVRSMEGKSLIDGAIRVSIGTIPQMKQFLEAFLQIN